MLRRAELDANAFELVLNVLLKLVRREARAVLREQPSLGCVGNSYDNAMAESWFGTLEAELLQERKFETRSEAVRELSDNIDGFYNPKRLHSGLGYVSPIRFELLASRTLAA